MAATRQIAFRLKPEGGAEVVNEVRKIEQAGVQANAATAAATDRATQAAERQEAQWRRNAEAMRIAASAARAQTQFNTVLGIGGVSGAGSASASADVFAAAFRADEDAARRAAQLKAEIDPLAAATDRYNAELREYEALQKRGAISTLEMARAQELAKGRLDATTAALAQNTNGLTRNQVASRLNLARQGADVAVTAAMGMNPAMIAIQQGPQIADALATSGIRASAGLLALGAGLTAAAGAATVAAVAWKEGESQALMLDRAVTGLGRTSGMTAVELETLAQVAAIQGEVSVRSAREQAAAYVQTGRIGEEIIGGLIAIGKDYAAVMGMDAEQATASLAKAMAEPDKAARELTRQIGLLDQETLAHIDTLVKHGDRLAAQKILLEALTAAVDGQAERVGSIESAWDGAARAVSNYWDALGRALYTTPGERLESLDQQIMGARSREAQGIRLAPGFISRLEEERAQLLRDQLDDDRRARASADAAENQAAQFSRDRTSRTSGTDRSGDRLARERLTRERQEQDRAAMIELEMSRALGDVDHVRSLEDEAALRERIRELVDADVEAGQARTTALREQGQLLAARAIASARETNALQVSAAIEVDRILGMERDVQLSEESAEWHGRINDYLEAGRGYLDAWLKASTDQLLVEQARADVMARMVETAAAEHQLTLARLAGREGEVQLLERQERIERRAREIEGREKLNFGAGESRARIEIDQEDVAKAEGVRRDWVKGFIDDIRQGGISDALGNQFESAADRLMDRLIDSLFEMDFAAIMGGKGKPGGGDWLSGLFNILVPTKPGKNARGTDWWPGGPSWVGEEGPELVNLPRGAQVIDADRSRRMAIGGGSGGGGPKAVSFTFAPVIHAEGAGPREIEALSAKMDAMAASLPTVVPQIVQDAMNRRVIR